MPTDKQFQVATDICATLRAKGHRAVLVGGCVRDRILNVSPKDYDVATSATPEEIAQLFEGVISVGAQFGVQMLVRPEGTFEVATFRKDGPYLDGRHPTHVEFCDMEGDARRRDFTINALFLDPETNEVIDYVGGQDDIRDGVIRCVGDPVTRFEEDTLRLLRAVRFAARLDYTIDQDTYDAILLRANTIHACSPERIRDELQKILIEGNANRGFQLLDTTGLLHEVLPEIAAMKGIEQPPEFHPEGDVFVHTLLLLKSLDAPTPTLALAALLHDVGKPLTQTFEDRIRFNNHDKVGARESEKICRRLHFSNAVTERVGWLVEQHMRVAATPDMRPSKLKRLVREEGFGELLSLFRLDCMASHGTLDTYDWLHDYAENLPDEELRPDLLITGNDLIAEGYRPGPQFADMLKQVEDGQLEESLTTRAEALAFVHARWPLDERK